ncbi:MAG: quinone-dependent dihydroorotate dehydrogenase [Bdellovibrionota bacterium]
MKELWMKPWLLIPPRWAHELGPYALRISSIFQPNEIPIWQPLRWRNFEFRNPLGLAGGVDKNGESVEDWWHHGVGFLEVGTVTPKPQSPNPGKIMARDLPTHSLWNRMGFPSFGAEEVLANLKTIEEKKTPLFLNLGKNRNTTLETASEDYTHLMRTFQDVADIFILNISSPNTQGLRLLQKSENFEKFLTPLVKLAKKLNSKPLIIKLSPDENDESLAQMILTARQSGIDGFVLTNTTTQRFGVPFPIEGGMSGVPLKTRSTECLKIAVETLGKSRDCLLISAGGVMNPEDVFERLALGADLVEVYTTLIYEGPLFFRKVAKAWDAKKTTK